MAAQILINRSWVRQRFFNSFFSNFVEYDTLRLFQARDFLYKIGRAHV